MAVQFKVDTREFDATLRKYAALSKRSPKEIVDKKALYIARGALWETFKTGRETIEAALGAIAREVRTISRGKNKGKFKAGNYIVNKSSLAEGIIRAAIWREGGDQPTKEAIKPMVSKFIAARRRGSGFLSSGWIWAIKTFWPLVKSKGGIKPAPAGVKAYKEAKGKGIPAKAGWRATSEIINSAFRKWDKRNEFTRIGGEGLQKAYNAEQVSMEQEIERRMRKDAQQAGIKTN